MQRLHFLPFTARQQIGAEVVSREVASRARTLVFSPRDVHGGAVQPDVPCAYIAGIFVAHQRHRGEIRVYSGGEDRRDYLVPRAVCDTGAGPSIVLQLGVKCERKFFRTCRLWPRFDAGNCRWI